MDEIKPARFSRRTLLNGAAGAALSAILSACTVATATATPARSTPTPAAAPPGPTRAATATSAGTTASVTAGATDAAGATGTTGTTTATTATDVAFFSPAGYTLAYRDAGALPLVNGEKADGSPAILNTFTVVRTDDPTKSLVELKAKNIAVVDGDPLLGHWIAAWMLQDRGKLVEGLDYTTSVVK